jgi:prolyl-tRNA editing enzyme YbaK/EbsC (Cys-tRNA(Pro) deacylase)
MVTQPATARVEAALRAQGLVRDVIELGESTRTAAEAAAACGVDVAQIVKSLVFLADGAPVLVLASGANQVDETRLAALTGTPIRRADAAAVRAATGFAIGGVPPVGHAQAMPVFIDRDLTRHPELIAAAGTPRAVIRLSPDELCRITAGTVTDLRREEVVRDA